MRKWTTKTSRDQVLVVIYLFSCLTCSVTFGEAADVGGQAQDQAVNAYIDRFVNFTLNKDVMGRAKKPTGEKVSKRPKAAFNADDGNPFQSELTYHDNAYNDIEEESKKGADGKAETKESVLYAWVSPHGKFAAGSASLLEKTAYDLHKQFSKQDEDPKNNKDDDKAGIKFRSIFKIQTQEVLNKDDKGGAGAANATGKANAKKEEPDKVERFTIRDEARGKIDKVGSEAAYEEMAKSARDPGFETDEKTLPNMTFLREAAARGAQAMWNSTLANLSQRRFFKAIQSGALGETPKINEDNPTADAWAQRMTGAIAKAAQIAPDQQKALQEDLNRMKGQAKQLSGISWDKIDPRYEVDDKAPANKNGELPETLKFEGVKAEDPFQRDMRVQLSVLDKAGTKASGVTSNWKYTAKDDQSTLANYDDGGQQNGTRQATVANQLDNYNQQLQDAAKGMEEIKSRYPGYNGDAQATLGYQIAPGTRNVVDINRPTESMMEEFGGDVGAGSAPVLPKNYDQLVKGGGEAQ